MERAGPALSAQRFVVRDGAARPAAYPRLEPWTDGRLALSVATDVSPSYFVHGGREVLVSADEGRSWTPCDDPRLPLCWPGSSVREQYDRATRVVDDHTFVAVGVVGWQAWSAGDRGRALAEGRYVTPEGPPGRPDLIGVGTNTVFVQRSTDAGATWTRREIPLTRAGWTLGLPRDVTLADGTLLLTARQRSADAEHGLFLVVRVRIDENGAAQVRVHQVPRDLDGRTGSEAAVAEVAPDRVVMLMRADATRGGTGALLASWSDDGGRSWTVPVESGIRGRPPHLLTLPDGRLLCTFAEQGERPGVRAVVSHDAGETWDVDAVVRLSEYDGPGSTSFHPMSLVLPDGRVYTVFHEETDRSCRVVGVRWTPPW